MSLHRRLQKELEDIFSNPLGFYKAGPISDKNLQNWEAVIMGPEDSAYFGGEFIVRIHFPYSYPASPPVLRMITRIYHPDIDTQGRINCSILGSGWRPGYNINKILLYITILLQFPSCEDSNAPDVAYVLRNFPEKFRETAELWTNLYAKRNYFSMKLVKIYQATRQMLV